MMDNAGGWKGGGEELGRKKLALVGGVAVGDGHAAP